MGASSEVIHVKIPHCWKSHVAALNYYVAAHEVLILIASASREGLGESTHMRRLDRAFASHRHKVKKKKKVQTKCYASSPTR